MESGAVIERGGGKWNKRGRGGNACEICFQRLIPPTLSTLLLSSILVLTWYSGAFQYDVIVQLRCFLSFNTDFKLHITDITRNALKLLAVVTLQTFYPGKLDLLTVYLGKLDFLSVTDFPLGNLPQGNFIV